MKEHAQDDYATLRAELAAMQEKLGALEAAQQRRPPQRRHKTLGWWQLSSSGLVLAVALLALLAPRGVSYAQKALEALFIDKDGRVGIGTTAPQRPLEVNNALKLTNDSPDPNDGVIGAKTPSPGLNIVGINTDKSHRKIALRGEITQLENAGKNTWAGDNNFTALRLSNDSSSADDGVIAAKRFAPGLNIVGINTDTSFRKIALWGEVTQHENAGKNTWKGNNDFSGGLTATPVAAQGDSISRANTPLPFRFDVASGVRKSFSLDEYCGDVDGCRVRFVCNKYNLLNRQPPAREDGVDASMLFVYDLSFFRMAYKGGVYIYVKGPRGENKIGHDLNYEDNELLSYKTTWFHSSIGLSVTSPKGQCSVTVYDN